MRTNIPNKKRFLYKITFNTASLLYFMLLSLNILGQTPFLEVPDPLSGVNPPYFLNPMTIPEIGVPYTDFHFGTNLVRATTTTQTSSRHEYSRFDPFNNDQSMIILNPSLWWKVYKTQTFPYDNSQNFVAEVQLEEPRWDLENSNIIWGVSGFKIKKFDVSTDQYTTIKDFELDNTIGPLIAQQDVYRITMKDEGESSMDKRYWAFILQGNASINYNAKYIFTWDMQTDSILGIYQIGQNENAIDWVGMSPLGNWVLIGGLDYNGGNLIGLTMANKELTYFHRLDFTVAHSDVGLDSEGEEIIVMQNTRTDFIDLIPIDPLTKPILEVGGSYENTNRTKLAVLYYNSNSEYGFQGGVHISCNFPGYCLVSTTIPPNTIDKNWLDRTITLIKLDKQNPRCFYLAKVYNTTDSYWEETHGTISNDGKKIVWADNWGIDMGQDYTFLTQLNMPENWQDLISLNNDEELIQKKFVLEQNYPNPFSNQTVINYSVGMKSEIEIAVFDILGNKIKTLFSGEQAQGEYQTTWDGTNDSGSSVIGGIYFTRFYSSIYSSTIKTILLK